jgi:hypothetical protein
MPGAIAREPLPAVDDGVDVLRVELDHPRLAPGLLAGDQGRPRPAERVEHVVSRLARVADRRSTSATGFIVGCRSFFLGLSKNQTSP